MPVFAPQIPHRLATDRNWTCVRARPNPDRQLTLHRLSEFYGYVIRYIVPVISSATSHCRLLLFGRHNIFCWDENRDIL
jgi:hypothetical protein